MMMMLPQIATIKFIKNADPHAGNIHNYTDNDFWETLMTPKLDRNEHLTFGRNESQNSDILSYKFSYQHVFSWLWNITH